MKNPREINRIKECRYGTMLYNPNDSYVGKSLHLYGEFSQGEATLFSELLSESDVVLDIGANIGTHTVFFAQAVGPQGTVHAFEPQRLAFQTLCANIALNSITNVVCYNAAVGHGRAFLSVPPVDPYGEHNFAGLSLLPERVQGEKIACVTVDGLELRECRLMKVDVEGMELDVLQGATDTIKRLAPILYVENDRPEKSTPLVRFIAGLRYDLYWHFPPMYNPDNYFSNRENVFGDIVSLNMVCVPEGSEWRPKDLKPVRVCPLHRIRSRSAGVPSRK